ncbi:hypothetical protein F2Q70_00028053 [Brassica cretica]|nr:hypothetical protein F2Q70_00028053 [Brassica cretica]
MEESLRYAPLVELTQQETSLPTFNRFAGLHAPMITVIKWDPEFYVGQLHFTGFHVVVPMLVITHPPIPAFNHVSSEHQKRFLLTRLLEAQLVKNGFVLY